MNKMQLSTEAWLEVKSGELTTEKLLFTWRFAREVSTGNDCSFNRASL